MTSYYSDSSRASSNSLFDPTTYVVSPLTSPAASELNPSDYNELTEQDTEDLGSILGGTPFDPVYWSQSVSPVSTDSESSSSWRTAASRRSVSECSDLPTTSRSTTNNGLYLSMQTSTRMNGRATIANLTARGIQQTRVQMRQVSGQQGVGDESTVGWVIPRMPVDITIPRPLVAFHHPRHQPHQGCKFAPYRNQAMLSRSSEPLRSAWSSGKSAYRSAFRGALKSTKATTEPTSASASTFNTGRRSFADSTKSLQDTYRRTESWLTSGASRGLRRTKSMASNLSSKFSGWRNQLRAKSTRDTSAGSTGAGVVTLDNYKSWVHGSTTGGTESAASSHLPIYEEFMRQKSVF